MSDVLKSIASPSNEKAKDWLEKAKWAPSGGNAQPWIVEFDENFNQVAFRLSIDPTYKTKASLMDVGGTASALSVGCLVENLILIAENDSFSLIYHRIESSEDLWGGAVQLLFEKKSQKISLTPKAQVAPEMVLERYTHRGIYNQKKLSDDFIIRFMEIIDEFKILKYKIFEPKNKLLYKALSALERVRWQHQPYMQGLLSEIGFRKDEKDSSIKIPSTQLGISYFDQWFLRALRKFPGTGKMLMKMGLAKIPVMKSTLRFVNNCQMVVFIQAPENDFSSSYKLGRCFQRLWIHCSDSGVAFQPNGNALIALGQWLTPEKVKLTISLISAVEEATEIFKAQFDFDLKKPVMGFRLGYSDERIERSPRKSIQSIRCKDLILKLQNEPL